MLAELHSHIRLPLNCFYVFPISEAWCVIIWNSRHEDDRLCCFLLTQQGDILLSCIEIVERVTSIYDSCFTVLLSQLEQTDGMLHPHILYATYNLEGQTTSNSFLIAPTGGVRMRMRPVQGTCGRSSVRPMKRPPRREKEAAVGESGQAL